jgi:signal transduction histidine kinase
LLARATIHVVGWVRRLRPSWIAWGLAACATALYPATLYLGLSAPPDVPAVLQLGWWGAVGSLVGVTYCVVGALILRRHPRHSIGWLASVGGFTMSFYLFAGAYAAYALGGHQLPGTALATWLRGWVWLTSFGLLFILIPALFPDGRFMSKRWRLLIWMTSFSAVSQVVAASIDPNLVGSGGPAWPIGTFISALTGIGAVLLLAAMFGAVAALTIRYWRSRGAERQQMKWFVAAVVVQGLLWAASLPPAAILRLPPYQVPYFEVVIPFALLAMPITIGVAILRERLYDVDLVISRGLAYATLAAFITAGYLVVVVGVGLLVGTGGRPNFVLSILATATVAVLFQPVRARVQALANRLVYGMPANPYEALARLVRSIGTGTVDEALLTIAQSISAGAKAERTRVSLLLPAGNSHSVEWPPHGSRAFDHAFPIRHHGELIGQINVAGGGDAAFAEALAHQAGLALRNLRLSAELADRLEQIEAQASELAASRMRLVAAQESERRRLERDLHDGVQQELVALIAKLRLARNQLQRDPKLATETLADLQGGIQRALTDLREVAHGIHPAVLSSQGLVGAVETMAGRMPIGVRVHAGAHIRSCRYAAEIEGAAYFVVAEGLANVMKHSGADQATVSIAAENSHLTLEVSDDGHGFASGEFVESGLLGLRDRVEALGGTLGIDSRPDGTRLRASLPARDRVHA